MRIHVSCVIALALLGGLASQIAYPDVLNDRLVWHALSFISQTTLTVGATNADTLVSWRLWWNSQDVYSQQAEAAAEHAPATASRFRPFTCGPQSERRAFRIRSPTLPLCEAIWLSGASVAYIRENGLWRREQVASRAAAGQISFPMPTSDPSKIPIELKTEWIRINGQRSAKYIVGMDDKGILRGLVAFHLMIHTRPNWVWATFIHEDFKQYVSNVGEVFHDEFGNTNSAPSQELLQLLASYRVGVLTHYRLIGAQIDFDAPLLLGNPLIEDPQAIRAQKISCMSCHSFAAMDGSCHNPTVELGPGHPTLRPGFFPVGFNYTMAVHSVPTGPLCSTGFYFKSQ